MMLVEEGKVRLEDKISTYLTGTPDTWKQMTVRHLLTHKAGLAELGSDFKSMVWMPAVWTLQMYDAAKNDKEE